MEDGNRDLSGNGVDNLVKQRIYGGGRRDVHLDDIDNANRDDDDGDVSKKSRGDLNPVQSQVRRPVLSYYRMALLGSRGILRYYEDGYIPEDLLD